jgi:hypothetical protein
VKAKIILGNSLILFFGKISVDVDGPNNSWNGLNRYLMAALSISQQQAVSYQP